MIAKKRSIEVLDLRQEPDPVARLDQLQAQEQLIVWGEADAKNKITCLDRFSLYSADTLAIWTIPPGPNEIRAVLERVMPSKVYLFGNHPGMDNSGEFLKYLAGLVKYQIKIAQAVVSLNSLAVATAQTLSIVKSGLEWLDAYGYIHLISIKDDGARIEAGSRKKSENVVSISSQLNSMLAESAAFRRYYLSANKERLVISEGSRD